MDSLLLVVLIYVIAFLPPMGTWSFVKPVLFIVGVFILEPVLVSFTGGTIGHHWRKIRVTTLSAKGNISLLAATVRFILKVVLGWFSLIVVLVTRKHQALHDLATRSLVVHATLQHIPARERLVDRPDLNETFGMPSRWRRVLVILGYVFLEYILFGVIAVLFASDSCLKFRRCTTMDTVVLGTGDMVWTVAVCLTIVFGWRGQIYGCRRSLKN